MTTRTSFDMLGRQIKERQSESDDEESDLEGSFDDEEEIISPAKFGAPLLTVQQRQQHLAPPQLTLSTLAPTSIERPLLRTRSTDGATVTTSNHSSNHATGLGGEENESLSEVKRTEVGNEFTIAEVPSPILTSPNLGLSGLSEKLAHLSSRDPSPAPSRKNSTSGPSKSFFSAFAASESTNNGAAQYPEGSSPNDMLRSPSVAAALIAQASKTGSRYGNDNVSSSALDESMLGKKPVRPSVTRPSSRRPSATASALQMDKSISAGPTPSDRTSNQRQTIRPIESGGQSTASASHMSTPGTSGKSTPLLTATSSSTRSKPMVLETSHLHLQTHAPSGRRMINQYVIEDELGRGVHGKVRLARDTETGEKVAVKIVEREGKKRLGQNSNAWSNRLSNKSTQTGASSPKGKEVDTKRSEGNPVVAIDTAYQQDTQNTNRQITTRFAPTPPLSPGSSLSKYQAAQLAARYGRWGEGAPSHDQELERQREKERKRLLWTTDQKVKREIAIMKKLAHENIVRLKEVIDDPASKKVFMVLEYMEGGEVQWKDERGFPTLTVDEARRTLRDVVLGLEYLHYQGIIHRDIKPANLLLDKDYKVKISDFGVSHFSYALLVASGGLPSMDSDTEKQKDPSLADDRELAKTAGSPAFFAPELCLAGEAPSIQTSMVNRHKPQSGSEFPWSEKDASSTPKDEHDTKSQIQSRPPITKAIDVWALGVTLYCLLFGNVPFTADNEFALFSVITKEDYELPGHMGADRIQIGPRRKRWIYHQPWTDEEGDVDEMHDNTKEADVDTSKLSEEALMVRDLLDRLLEKDPSKRIKLDEVKKHPWLTRDLEDPPLWLSETDPSHLPFVEVTNEDVETALTGFSKIKQTLKKLQNRFWAGFTGHAHERQNEKQRGSTEETMISNRGKRRRSKSASHARPNVQLIIADSSQASPQSTLQSRESTLSRSNHVGPNSHPPLAPSSGRPHHFFSRRRSVALDGNKQFLAKSAEKKSSRIFRNSYSQPGSRSHSPTNLDTFEHSSILADKEFVKINSDVGRSNSIRKKSSKRHEESVQPLSALSPIVSGKATEGESEILLPISGHEASVRSRRGGSRMRPASRGSLRGFEGFSLLHQPHKSVDALNNLSNEKDANSMRERNFSGSTTSSQGPSRPRSRSRLSEVFRHVWPGGGHGGEDPIKHSRFRSRPQTAVNSAAVSPSLDKSVKMLQQEQRSVSEGVTSKTNVEVVHSLPLKEEKVKHQSDIKVSESRPSQSISSLQNQQQQIQITKPEHETPKAIDVDEYDVDWDISDDDSDIHRRESSKGDFPGQIWHGTSDGWKMANIIDQQDSSSASETKNTRTHESPTPSVEGGYNVFKPPFKGKFQLAGNGERPKFERFTTGTDSSSDHGLPLETQDLSSLRRAGELDTVDQSKSIRMPVATHSYIPGPEVAPGDLTIMSDDRFADADEITHDYEEEGEEEGSGAPDSQSKQHGSSTDGSGQVRKSFAPFMQRGHSVVSSSHASDTVSAIDDDDVGVSFKAGRRNGQ
ncbi:hypothetical protein L7F22_019222 [Adiantum nelumboides]|nr:hypothetical protein [Adiantum nelumboides]